MFTHKNPLRAYTLGKINCEDTITKRSITLWQVVGFAATSVFGTLLHFLYGWLGKSPWAAPFSAVNESTWEHMKIMFWPMFLYAIVQSFFFRDRKDFWCIKLRGISVALVLIPVLFYTYSGAIAKPPALVNILIFFSSAAVAFLYEIQLFDRVARRFSLSAVAFAMLCAIALCFVLFTFFTPKLGIFLDPVTGTYGV